jgi:hypothetical protein
MELAIEVPLTAAATSYGIRIAQGDETLLSNPNSFMVVDRNWTRQVRVEPALMPGGVSEIVLVGRDLDNEFISKIKVEVDEPGLEIGKFARVSSTEARARVSASAAVAPGDYLLTMVANGKPVTPQFGSIIRVEIRR